MKTKPFIAIRPAEATVAKIAAVPYDVVDSREAAELAAGNPLSFLHVSRPEIDLPAGTGIYSDAVYAQARKALSGLVESGAMLRDADASYYIYRQQMGGHVQTGVVACCHIDDYGDDVIRKHEKTRQDKEDDRTRHVLETGANTGPVFLTYRDVAAIDAVVAECSAARPLYDFVSDDGNRHSVWKVPARVTDTMRGLLDKVPLAYVADGHHRAKAAWRAGSELRAAGAGPDAECNWFLAVLFPASQLMILPYNRLVADLNGLTADAFLARCGEVFTVASGAAKAPSAPRSVSMYLGGKWYSLAWPEFGGDPVSVLDVSVLQERLLAPVLGIADPRTDSRISFAGGIRGTGYLEAEVDSGRAAVAFSMAPVTVGQMMSIADAGAIMPPKSTWFEPKLRSGLFVHEIR
ncbi:MAG: DUF1015 domain-containing protein [Kiritimatiellae bacterium]|nr:DUF1015 domain-containing protein [Kiritimatiellia bacterium]